MELAYTMIMYILIGKNKCNSVLLQHLPFLFLCGHTIHFIKYMKQFKRKKIHLWRDFFERSVLSWRFSIVCCTNAALCAKVGTACLSPQGKICCGSTVYIKINWPGICCKIPEKAKKRTGLPRRDPARDSRAGIGRVLSPCDQSP